MPKDRSLLELLGLVAKSLGALKGLSYGVGLGELVTHVLIVLLHHSLGLVVRVDARVSLLGDSLFLFNRL